MILSPAQGDQACATTIMKMLTCATITKQWECNLSNTIMVHNLFPQHTANYIKARH